MHKLFYPMTKCFSWSFDYDLLLHNVISLDIGESI